MYFSCETVAKATVLALASLSAVLTASRRLWEWWWGLCGHFLPPILSTFEPRREGLLLLSQPEMEARLA
jgi:hypothetical protein